MPLLQSWRKRARKGGEGPKGKEEDSGDAEPTLTIRAYLPHTSEMVEVSVLHTEVKFLLNASIDWLHASENSTASMHFMRPYWREKVAPLAERLTLNMEPIGGLDFNTQCLLLDVDRCVFKDRPAHRALRRPNLHEGSLSEKHFCHRQGRAQAGRKESRAYIYSGCSSKPLAQAQQDGAQPAQTIRNVLPLSVLERKAGLGQTCDGFLDAGKRDELIEKLIAKLRLTLLIPHDEKFARAISFETLYHSTPEIQAIFPWQSTKRSLVIAIPRDESDIKFLKLYQQEAIKAAKKRRSHRPSCKRSQSRSPMIPYAQKSTRRERRRRRRRRNQILHQ